MPNSVICIAHTQIQTESLVTQLQVLGVPPTDISVLVSDRPMRTNFMREQMAKVPEGTSVGGGAGGLAGGIFGLLAGMGILAIPGAGLFIAAGPIIAALSGAALGAAVGGISGALVGMGLPETKARRYEAKVKQGSALLSVRTVDRGHARRIKRIMQWAQAEDIAIVQSMCASAAAV